MPTRKFFLPFLALLGACFGGPPDPDRTRGILEARKDIATGNPRLLFVGPPPPDLSPLDPETGLLRASAGSEDTPKLRTYVQAYNETIRTALAQGRIRRGLFKDRALTREVLEKAFRGRQVHTLRLGDAPLTSPDGRFSLSIAVQEDGQAWLWWTHLAVGRRVALHPLAAAEAKVRFGHGGLTVAVRDEAARRFLTFDLEGPHLLQVFPDPKRP